MAMNMNGDASSVEDRLEVLGGGMRHMVDLINRLRASGIEDLGLPLPKIAVIGNQSAGKSSLIEAISGVSSSLIDTVMVPDDSLRSKSPATVELALDVHSKSCFGSP